MGTRLDVVQLKRNYSESQTNNTGALSLYFLMYITCQTCKLIFNFILKHSVVPIRLNCQR